MQNASGFLRNAGGAPLDRRYQLGVDAASVLVDGTEKNGASICASANVITSTGAFSTYTIFFPITFDVAPRLTAWTGLESGGSFTLMNLMDVTTTFFQFALMAFGPGQVVVPNGHTVIVEWIAIGK